MNFLNQTRRAVKNLPLFSKSIMFAWGAVPIIFLVPNITMSTLLYSTLAIIFTLIWMGITIAITLINDFFRQHKITINEYAADNSTPKISSQSIAAAMQSNDAYQNLIKRLPPHLTDDLELYVGTKWGRISKAMMIATFVSYLGAVVLTAKLLS